MAAELFIQRITVTFANEQTATIDNDGDTTFGTEELFSPSELDVVQQLSQLVVKENGN